MSDKELVEVDVDVISEHPASYRVEYEGRTIFLPKSLCRWEEEGMMVPEWLAMKEGLI